MQKPRIAKERTLLLIKPDVLQRQIVGEILSRFERKGFGVIAGVKILLYNPIVY